jgi:hypothetical protein
MKHLFINSVLIISILICVCCSNVNVLINNKNFELSKGVNLVISYSDTTISKELLIRCMLINHNTKDIAFLGRNNITTIESWTFVWYAEIIYKGSGKQKMGPFVLLGDFKLPTTDEYIVIKPGEDKNFSFKFNFNELVDKSDLPIKVYINKDYGEYSIKITYKDSFCKHGDAISGPIESNTLNIIYIKQ